VSRWERGYATPSPYFREHLCRLFEKSAHDLGFLQDAQAESEQESSLPLPSLEASSFEERSGTQVQNQPVDTLDRRSRVLASLSYLLGWVSGCFLLLLMRKKRFVRFHSLQSLLFFGGAQLLFMTLLVLLRTTDAARGSLQEYLGIGLTCLLLLLLLFTCMVWVMGMVQAWHGRWYQVPVVGHLSKQIVTKRFRLQSVGIENGE
jgi:uncharacterized membrane protein